MAAFSLATSTRPYAMVGSPGPSEPVRDKNLERGRALPGRVFFSYREDPCLEIVRDALFDSIGKIGNGILPEQGGPLVPDRYPDAVIQGQLTNKPLPEVIKSMLRGGSCIVALLSTEVLLAIERQIYIKYSEKEGVLYQAIIDSLQKIVGADSKRVAAEHQRLLEPILSTSVMYEIGFGHALGEGEKCPVLLVVPSFLSKEKSPFLVFGHSTTLLPIEETVDSTGHPSYSVDYRMFEGFTQQVLTPFLIGVATSRLRQLTTKSGRMVE